MCIRDRAWGPVLENAGLEAGTTIATAAATFGLVAGALLGGPVGRYLIEHNNLKPSQDTNAIMSVSYTHLRRRLRGHGAGR